MKSIDTQINRARIISYSVTITEDMPQVSATIGLFAGERQVSTFQLSTEPYYGVQFDLPVRMITPIKDIAEELETILVRSCSQSIGELPAPKGE